MIIKKLVLHNLGVYASTNIFEFSGEKPIVLIGGMNGRGKTTFLEAVLIALYGSNSFAYHESSCTSYGKYLRAYINTRDGSYETFIELEFSMGDRNADTYCIRREWSDSAKRIKEIISVKKNGMLDEFLTENWAMLIESILPSGLSNFFFFDGEKIAELAAEDTNSQVKESIKALLGITVLDQLESDVGRIISRMNKKMMRTDEEDELAQLREKKEKAESEYNALLEEIEAISKQHTAVSRKLERARNTYLAKGGDIATKRQDLFQERVLLAAKEERIQGQLTELAASCLPLGLVSELLDSIEQQAVLEHNSQVACAVSGRIEKLYAQFIANTASNRSAAQKFMQYVRAASQEEYVEQIYHLSDSGLYQVKTLRTHQIQQQRQEVQALIGERDQIHKRIAEIEQYLSIEIDEKALSRAYKNVKLLEQEHLDLEIKLNELDQKRSGLHSESTRTATAFNHAVEDMLTRLELNDDSERTVKYAHQAIKLVREYRVQLQSSKIAQLADTMTACYKKLASKKNLIAHIEMDPVTLDFQYKAENGDVVSKSSLSAGEKQLMVISILWALAICSKKKLPVIIDTPLSRLDSAHRTSLINTYFPQASEQTIILSTDSEIDQRYYQMMKENVGDEYTLVYDDDQKCSTIKRGYFDGGEL